jgi:hypothetical protein
MVTKRRVEKCVMCGARVVLVSCTAEHPEAPEMLRGHGYNPFLGITSDGTLVVVCSQRCVDLLLREELDKPEEKAER